MSKLLRYYEPGQCYFITSVTYQRRRILDCNAELLLKAVRRARRTSRFTILAFVILPDHIHVILETPYGDAARIVQQIKLSFSLQFRWHHGGSGPVWQHRYWDHIIRSPQDLTRHVDYIHYNAVKHGLTDSPGKWRLSSFRKYERNGFYAVDWGVHGVGDTEGEFGE